MKTLRFIPFIAALALALGACDSPKEQAPPVVEPTVEEVPTDGKTVRVQATMPELGVVAARPQVIRGTLETGA